ncbi:MAG: hypothetical protein GWN00_20030, partial [Aliifodinibius sp.]|nr:hypothetical protein [Fodinibius sp.]NIY27011.1 hypothetical protein [Fodinibius sp.]
MTEEALAADSGQGSFDLDSGVGQLGSDLFGVDASQEASHEKDDNTSETPDKQAVGDDDSIQEPSQQIEPRTAPQSWKKEMHDAWGTLAPEVQDYIELREKQM